MNNPYFITVFEVSLACDRHNRPESITTEASNHGRRAGGVVVEISERNPNGFSVYRDELAGWFYSLNKDNQKENAKESGSTGLCMRASNGLKNKQDSLLTPKN
jgi:hypothetical protein